MTLSVVPLPHDGETDARVEAAPLRHKSPANGIRGRKRMLTHEENELLTRVGPGTPMGELIRRFWVPACLSEELPEPDCDPIRVRLLGEDLVAFRDSAGRVGVLAEYCPHRRASLFFGRNEEGGLRCLYHGWKMDVDGRVLDTPCEPADSTLKDR